MTAQPVPASEVARDLRGMIRDVHDMNGTELLGAEDKAARCFTGASLAAGAAFLGDEIEAARDLWLAVQAEWEARR